MKSLLGLAFVLFASPSFAGEVSHGGIGVRTPNTDPTQWVGFAAAPDHRVFQSAAQRNETAARNEALQECQSKSQRTCSGIAVTSQADVIAIGCNDGNQVNAFVGGSTQGNAMEVALGKAKAAGFSANSCKQIFNY